MSKNSSPETTVAWHTLTVEQAVKTAHSDAQRGLDQGSVAERQDRDGPNALPAIHKRGPFRRLLAQFHNVLIYVLLLAAVITFLLDQPIDSAVILAVVLINAVIGFIQEGKAESALEKIRGMLSPTAQVLRGGVRAEIDATQLVVGDIVYLAAGDKVPADMRLLKVYSLYVDEAALTGESLAVEKAISALDKESDLADRTCMVYSGTLVTAGQAMGLVTGIGRATEIGRISQILAAVQELQTPLMRKMDTFGKWLSLAIIGLSGLTFAYGTFVWQFEASIMFIAAVGIAVAAIPEGLPAIMTIALAIGVQRMAQRKAIIRKLPVVEALGSVTVICSDKTGTLTRNEMTVERVVTAELDAKIEGSGYQPKGKFLSKGQSVESADFPVLQQLGRVSALCNDAQISEQDGHWVLAGDPTEGALLTLAAKMGLHAGALEQIYPRADVVPFDSDYQFMATLHPTPSGEHLVFLKGAPERVLELCDTVQLDAGTAPIDRQQWAEQMAEIACEGMRVLAIAEKVRDPAVAAALSVAEVRAGGFRLLGLVGMTDPPRDEVIAAIKRCHTAGIDVKMITGDHVSTARSIAERIGIGWPLDRSAEHIEPISTLTGSEIDQLTGPELEARVTKIHVFARATPEHKLRLVQALQSLGHVVSMTGDGVNDAPALKRADVGVAMGLKGTEAAKEAAEMVLADDNFASIAAAVEEGRTVYDNIRKAIGFILPTNGGQAGMLIVAILFGLTLPITPVQILWVNMVTAVTLALALAFEHSEHNIMRRPPRPPREPIVQGFLVWRIVLVSLLLVGGGLGLFLYELGRGETLEAARTAAINALVVGEIAYLFNSRRMKASVMNWSGLFGNPAVLWASGILVVFQLCLTYIPVMNHIFGTAPISLGVWGTIILFGLALFFLIELEKKVVARA